MTIKIVQNDEKTIFVLAGRLDTITAPQLQNTLIPAFEETLKITLDFSSLAYISSAGLRVLLMGQKTAKAKDAVMEICGVSEEIMDIFEMTGFANILTIV